MTGHTRINEFTRNCDHAIKSCDHVIKAIQCTSPQKGNFRSNLFLVSKKDGDHRPIINLKSLNNLLSCHHFKMEGLNAVKYLLQQNNYMYKIDLQDAYFCIPLQRSSQRFIRFQWEGSLYKLLCLRLRLRPFQPPPPAPYFYKNSTQTENSRYSLFGPHIFDESDGGQNLHGPRYIRFSAAMSRICNKHKVNYPSIRRWNLL